MNKKTIIIIAVSLALLLVGVVVAFAVQNRNDPVKDDETVKNHSDKESISSKTEDSEATKTIYSETDDIESKEPEHKDDETSNTLTETTRTEKETDRSDKDPAQTEAPSKKSTATKPTVTKPTTTKAITTKATTTKATTTKATTTKATTTKATTTKATTTTTTTVPERNEPIAADFTVFDESGNQVHLSDYAGKPVILNFWASWCVPCKKEMPDFNEKYLEYGDEIQFLMIDFAKDDKIEDAKKYITEMGFAFPIFFDVNGDVVSAYEIKGFPTTVFIDADGYIVERFQGTLSAEKLQSGIDKILK